MAAAKKDVCIHNHPHYRRWSGIVQRTSNCKNRGYKQIGARKITMAREWAPCNPFGLANFGEWVEKQLAIQPEFKGVDFKVTRKDINKDYTPTNCFLALAVKVCQNRATNVLNEELVIKMRRYKRLHPDATLFDLAAKFEHDSQVNISRCLRGITWSSVNSIEPPILKKGMVEKVNPIST
jgi:hypothetical protein